MKKFIITSLSVLVFSTSAMAFSLSDVTSNLQNATTEANANKEKLTQTTCLTQEAKSSLTDPNVKKDSLMDQAETIATTCATKMAVQKAPESVQTAAEIIQNLTN